MALLGSALAGAAYFIGKRLRAEDFENEQDYKLARRSLLRGVAVLIALQIFLNWSESRPDDP